MRGICVVKADRHVNVSCALPCVLECCLVLPSTWSGSKSQVGAPAAFSLLAAVLHGVGLPSLDL